MEPTPSHHVGGLPEIVSHEAAEPSNARPPGKLLSYLQLTRLPNVFTAIADVWMGFFITSNSLSQWPSWILLTAASACIYTAGMVLNDVFDIDIDREERPSRPLPSGGIDLFWARWVGFQLLLMGVAAGWLAGFASNIALGPPWRSGVIATSLAGMVLLYDRWAKKTPLGPWVMGSCRFLNVLLGMSLNAAAFHEEFAWMGFGLSHASIAGGIGMYIVGVTWFARSEATRSARGGLILGILGMVAGIVLLALFPHWSPAAFRYRYEPLTTWPLAVLMISVWILRRPVVALRDPSPHRVQFAVKNCILSLIILDAIVCSFACELPWAVSILALLAPTLLLGRWVYST